MGNSDKFCPNRARLVLEALAQGNTLAAAAANASISPNLLAKWRRERPEFDRQCFEARGVFARKAVRHITEAMESGVWQAAAWWLERSDPENWGRRQHVETVHRAAITVIEAVPPPQLTDGEIVDGHITSDDADEPTSPEIAD